MQAACKTFDKDSNLYKSKILRYHPTRKDVCIKVPRLAPPESKLVPVFRQLEKEIGVTAEENGRLALQSFSHALTEMLERDCGKKGHPKLEEYTSRRRPKRVVISFDATGFGKQQFNTVALRNPENETAAASQLFILGLGNCADDKGGTTRLLGGNLPVINAAIRKKERKDATGKSEPTPIVIHDKLEQIEFDLKVTVDVSAARHTEHIINSGLCACGRDHALRQNPTTVPKTVAEMETMLLTCKSLSREERYTLTHGCHPCEPVPRPCIAHGCKFGHNRATAAADHAAMLKQEKELESDKSKKGKAAFAKWRLDHAKCHLNIQPGEYGRPMLEHHLDDQIVDSLHLSKLNLPKICFKYAILTNASDDARAEIADQLKEWKHPLDTRRKDDGRARADKWFTGEKWGSFCEGTRGSPGGPKAIAKLVLIIAEDMQRHGTAGRDLGPFRQAEQPTQPMRADGRGGGAVGRAGRAGGRANARAGGRGRGRGAFAATVGVAAPTTSPAAAAVPVAAADAAAPLAADVLQATRAGVQHVPSAAERAAAPNDPKIIRDLYGSRSQTIINALLAFDAFFAWYYPYEDSIAIDATQGEKDARALDNMQKAIVMTEAYERVSICNHKSFLPHLAIFKVTKNIRDVGDVHAYNLSPLELQNADTKRTASSNGARRLQTSDVGVTHAKKTGKTVDTKGYGTTMALSTLSHLLINRYLRRGDGIFATPASRRAERLFGESGRGRVTLARIGEKLSKSLAGDDWYDPRADTCVKAFLRLVAELAEGESLQ